MSLLTRNPFDLTVTTAGKLDQNRLRRIDALNTDISNGITSVQDVWFNGGIKTWMTFAQKLEIVSTSVNDTRFGTGATRFFVQGLDADFNEIEEGVFMDGTTPVQTALEYIRVNQLVMLQPGTFTETNGPYTHDGEITITAAVEGHVEGKIGFDPETGVGYSRALNSHYSSPDNTTGYILDIKVGTNSNFNFRLNFFGRDNSPGGEGNLFTIEEPEIVAGSGLSELGGVLPIVIPPKADLWATTFVNNAALVGRCTFGYNILVIDDPA